MKIMLSKITITNLGGFGYDTQNKSYLKDISQFIFTAVKHFILYISSIALQLLKLLDHLLRKES